MNVNETLAGLSPERKEAILNRAEQLIREERERAGRSAPESNQDARWTVAAVAIGAVFGALLAIASLFL